MAPSGDLQFNSFQKFLFGQSTDVAHNIFDPNAGANEGETINGGHLSNLAHYGGCGGNMKLGFTIPERVHMVLQEVYHFLENAAIEGHTHFGYFFSDFLLIHLLVAI